VKVSSLDLIKRVRQNSRARLIYDHSDALWLPHHAKAYAHIRDILRIVDAVTWDYKYTYDFVKQFNENVFHWPAASQVELFDRSRRPCDKKKDEIIIGWVGGGNTLFNLYIVWEALEKIFIKHNNVHLKLIGTGTNSLLIPNFEQVRYLGVPYYGQQEMIKEILNIDIGLFPLFDVEDSRVRGFLKALVYMSGEAAIIASPCGQIPALIQDGVNGMLAKSTVEWVEKLDLLITNHALRKRIAAAGLETVRRDFSLEKSFECLLHALDLQNY
jgi:glycosyltransferase involved in cell wall biosynthesis